MSKSIENKIVKFIHEYNLIQNGDNLIIGVSGGADSMMLLHFLYTHKSYYQIKIAAAHVHHGLREEAEEDAQLVQQTCTDWQIPFFRHDCNIKALAKTMGQSEEEVGRTERYNFFISLSNPRSKIVTAHTMNDQAETLIMRFLRGTDINGLGGIPPRRENIIRPLLCLKREEIEAYCSEHQIPYRNDHTNFLPIYTRNKIRLECIPYIEQAVNPNIISLLGEHSHLYRESEDFLRVYSKKAFDECAEKAAEQVIIDIEQLASCHKYIQMRIIFLALEALNGTIKDITLKHIDSIAGLLKLQSGKNIVLPYDIKVSRQYNKLIFSFKVQKEKNFSYRTDMGITKVSEIKGSLSLKQVEKETIKQKNEKMYTKYIDYGKIKVGLQIRSRQPQDYIVTTQGTKKLKKLFIDDKVPKELRNSMPLIADGNEIVWVVGGRLNTNYYITENTKDVLEMQINFE